MALGLRDAGYVYLNVDDGWAAPARGADGRLEADAGRFPGGLAALAEYAHARGEGEGLKVVGRAAVAGSGGRRLA